MFRLLSLVQAIEQAKLNTCTFLRASPVSSGELSLMCMIKVHVRKSDLQERLYEMPCGSMDESLKGSLSQCTIKFITLTLKSIRVHSLRASPYYLTQRLLNVYILMLEKPIVFFTYLGLLLIRVWETRCMLRLLQLNCGIASSAFRHHLGFLTHPSGLMMLFGIKPC
ncbi:uncharacterized protein MELLADRAFT_90343 [Melampsora larici-populina 98AG31]|uniref:Uncharacterized protein n=1 Tax=Melampsora larici-populina (strain 98AG31 / pathotype 3-4-7) TaxID=747676 RepID=F4RWL0_MELLP|nr:uncharacterized protein MELLADRAFT_90343 [Melampsora larici-populina 98AG31]EGG03301.1 hypothetical protein MELLADRAFT_90343 [Melampsora larici-populina 98AG31]